VVKEAHLKPCYPHVAVRTRKHTRTLSQGGGVRGCGEERESERERKRLRARERVRDTQRWLIVICCYAHLAICVVKERHVRQYSDFCSTQTSFCG
jgi:hypothetical protein